MQLGIKNSTSNIRYPDPGQPRECVVAVLSALAIGLLTLGAWMLITWTPLPPQQFAADLIDVPPSRRDIACTDLGLRKSRGPYDASMLTYAFDPDSGLCIDVGHDGFRERVMEARVRHLKVASILGVLAMLGWRARRRMGEGEHGEEFARARR